MLLRILSQQDGRFGGHYVCAYVLAYLNVFRRLLNAGHHNLMGLMYRRDVHDDHGIDQSLYRLQGA